MFVPGRRPLLESPPPRSRDPDLGDLDRLAAGRINSVLSSSGTRQVGRRLRSRGPPHPRVNPGPTPPPCCAGRGSYFFGSNASRSHSNRSQNASASSGLASRAPRSQDHRADFIVVQSHVVRQFTSQMVRVTTPSGSSSLCCDQRCRRQVVLPR